MALLRCGNRVFQISILLFLVAAIPSLQGQNNCSLSISGTLTDADTDEPLSAAYIWVSELDRGAVTDSIGRYRLDALCVGTYHLELSHIGCEPKTVLVELERDRVLDLSLDHSTSLLNEVVVSERATPTTTQPLTTIAEQTIVDNAYQSLSNLLEGVTGVRALRNGNGISKPVVHGLYGNRLTLLNNGIAQSGQQWGNDHSPEIDPTTANRITVVKGTAALEYPGAQLGSVILVEPAAIEREPHLHGRVGYSYETNGRGHGLNLQLQRYHPGLAFRLSGTLKRSGDQRAPGYFLNNTGIKEANLALQLERSWDDRWFLEGYASTFNTELGILRGAHLGNLTDLNDALNREVPFFTDQNFSYTIEPPRQRVHHQLAKLNLRYYPDQSQFFEATLAGQFNNRQEFDVRRSGRSDIPALKLLQYNGFGALRYQKEFENGTTFKSGTQLSFTDNRNDPETGILPLIPNYTSTEIGGFALLSKQLGASLLELGGRFDRIDQRVLVITQTTPREIVRFDRTFNNLSASFGWTYAFGKSLSVSTQLGYATRNPAVNELYSNGLHQGVSGIEEGDPDLQSEHSVKMTLGAKGKIGEQWRFELLGYYQQFDDYIYLEPQSEVRLTIRGAFPVFLYAQTDAHLYGVDFSGTLNFTEELRTTLKYSYLQGTDRALQEPLLFLPPNNLSNALEYVFQKPLSIGRRELRNVELQLSNEYVFGRDIAIGRDFAVPPGSYHLLGARVAGDLKFSKARLRLIVKATNVLDRRYRDYLNRQRYFADDLGRSVVFSGILKF